LAAFIHLFIMRKLFMERGFRVAKLQIKMEAFSLRGIITASSIPL